MALQKSMQLKKIKLFYQENNFFSSSSIYEYAIKNEINSLQFVGFKM